MRAAAAIALVLMATPVAAAERYFAELDADGTVLRVIVADPEFVAKMPGRWVETRQGDPAKPYAGRGHKYDQARGRFTSPKPYPSWTLDEEANEWKPPIAPPVNGPPVIWNETLGRWMPDLDRPGAPIGGGNKPN